MTVVNVQNWKQMEKKARDKVQRSATKLVQYRVALILRAAVKVSPQWSGNYAANWTIETNQAGSASYTRFLKVEPWWDLQWWDTDPSGKTRASKHYSARVGQGIAKSAGDGEAVAWSKALNEKLILGLKWNTNVKLVNRAPVADLLDSGGVSLRNVNKIDGKLGVVLYLKSRYPNILS